MPLDGQSSHAGGTQVGSAQANRDVMVPSFAAGVMLSEEVAIDGLARQALIIAQAAGGQAGLLAEVQFVINSDFFTVETIALIAGAPNSVWLYNVPARAWRIRLTNPGAGLSGNVTIRLCAAGTS